METHNLFRAMLEADRMAAVRNLKKKLDAENKKKKKKGGDDESTCDMEEQRKYAPPNTTATVTFKQAWPADGAFHMAANIFKGGANFAGSNFGGKVATFRISNPKDQKAFEKHLDKVFENVKDVKWN